jgi:hypothetical protein
MASTRWPTPQRKRRHRARAPGQVEAGLVAGHPVQLLADCEPAPVPLHPYVSAAAAGFAEDQDPVPVMRGRSDGIDRLSARPRRSINRIIIQSLNRAKWPWYTKPLIQSRFIGLLAMNLGSIPSDLIVARTDSTP